MLSSDDSSGWSAASDDTMSSSEDEQGRQASSVQERKTHKKQLRESLQQSEHTSNVVPSGIDLSENRTEDSSRKNKKKKKVKEGKSELNFDENVNTPEQEMIDKIINLEAEDSPKEKKKKKKIVSEPEEQHVIEEASPRKKNKKIQHHSELQETVNVDDVVVKLEDTVHTPKKTKKKRKQSVNQEEADIETQDQSFEIPSTSKKMRKDLDSRISEEHNDHQHFNEILNDSAQPSSAMKNKKKNIYVADATDIELTREKAREFIRKDSVHFDNSEIKQEATNIKYKENYTSSATLKSPSHKNSTSSSTSSQREVSTTSVVSAAGYRDNFLLATTSSELLETENVQGDVVKHEDTGQTSTKKKKKSKLEEEHVIEEVSQRKKNKKSKRDSELQETGIVQDDVVKLEDTGHTSTKNKKKSKLEEQHVIEEVSQRKKNKKSKRDSELQETGIVQDDVVKLEDTGHTPKKKKKKSKHSVKREEENIETQDGSIVIPSTSKKCRKNNESQSSDDHNHHQDFNEILDDSAQTSSAMKNKKKKKILVADSTDVELTREKAREFIRKNSVHFDSSKIKEEGANIKHKDSTSSATLKSPSHKNSISSTSSARRISITSVVSGGRRDNSSSAATSTRKVSISSIASSKRRRSSSSSPHRSRSRSSSSSSAHSKPPRSKTPEKVESRRKSNSPDSRTNSQPNRSRKSAPSAYRVEETRKRTNLSEKIRFEDDTDGPESETDIKTSKNDSSLSALLDKFMDKNPKLKPVRSIGSDEAIGSDDDVWVLKCPKGYDHEKLKEMDMTIDTKTKIKLDGQTFDGVLEDDTHRIAIVFPSQQQNKFVIKDVRPKGTLIFRKRIPDVHINEMSIAVPRETFIPLPETKRRHPLFGHDYRKFIKTPTTVVERLNETEPRKKLKSKRKHKIEKIGKDEPDFPSQEGVEIKKKKKRKRKLSDTGSGESLVKKLKHDPDSTIVWDSEKAIAESLFNF